MKTILIVEDEDILREVIKDELVDADYKVIDVATGKQCIEQLEQITPDLIILDIKLPDISGLKLLEEIRKRHKALPILMCTAYNGFKDAYEIWSSNVSDYIVKPIDLEVFKEKIKRILG